MKNIVLILACALFMASFVRPAATATLHVTITGIEKPAGYIRMGLYNKKEGFLDDGKHFKNAIIPVKGSTATFTFRDLPPGSYAIGLYHDKNGDNKCNRNFMGIPEEGYAFSNNIRPKFSQPSFEECRMNLSGTSSITIAMIN